jgi:hypothetical protein
MRCRNLTTEYASKVEKKIIVDRNPILEPRAVLPSMLKDGIG